MYGHMVFRQSAVVRATIASVEECQQCRQNYLLDAVAALLIGLGFLGLVSSTPNIPDGYDAYRHVKVAALMLEAPGTMMKDPWRLAFLWPKPFDVWFGYELLLAPFTKIFGMIAAAKVFASLIFAAISFVLLRLLQHFQVVYRIGWLIIAIAGSSITLNRATTSRPFLLAILLVLAIALFTFEDRPVAVGLLSALHALSYSMFFLAAVVPVIWLLLRRDSRAVRLMAFCAGGIAVGLLINPYFPQSMLFAIATVSVVSIASKAHVSIGGELYPMIPGWFLLASLPVVLVWGSAAVARLRQWRESGLVPKIDLLLAVSLVALAGSFQVGRTVDFFVPFGVVFAAVVLSPWLIRHQKDLAYICVPIFFWCAVNVFLAYRTGQQSIEFGRYRGASEYLQKHAPGELVANAQWGDYHYLFFWNSSNRYVIGIEPTATYRMDPKKYWIWRHMSDDERFTCDHEICAEGEHTDIATAVAGRLHARHIFTDHQLNPTLESVLRKRAGVTEAFRDSYFSVFRLDL
jgi:hypothetical protein